MFHLMLAERAWHWLFVGIVGSAGLLAVLLLRGLGVH